MSSYHKANDKKNYEIEILMKILHQEALTKWMNQYE